MQFRHIMWDFNGTLMDDVHTAFAALQVVFQEFALAPITLSEYRERFRHPVKDFYLDHGVQPEQFPALAERFIAEYSSRIPLSPLHEGALQALRHFREKGCTQSVLSAAEQNLLNALASHYGISEYFVEVLGLSDNYAVSKVKNAQLQMQRLRMDAGDILFIGDTDHDAEVAHELGCHCVLIANGHQSVKVLEKTGRPVLASLQELTVWCSTHS